MSSSNQKIGKVFQWFGWLSVAQTVLTYGYALFDASSDASISAYAPLIALEALLFLGGGLLIVWFGRWIAKPARAVEPDQG